MYDFPLFGSPPDSFVDSHCETREGRVSTSPPFLLLLSFRGFPSPLPDFSCLAPNPPPRPTLPSLFGAVGWVGDDGQRPASDRTWDMLLGGHYVLADTAWIFFFFPGTGHGGDRRRKSGNFHYLSSVWWGCSHHYRALRFKRPSPSVTLYGAHSPRKKGLSASGRYFSIDDSAQKKNRIRRRTMASYPSRGARSLPLGVV